MEKLLLKIEPSEITSFFYNNSLHFGVHSLCSLWRRLWFLWWLEKITKNWVKTERGTIIKLNYLTGTTPLEFLIAYSIFENTRKHFQNGSLTIKWKNFKYFLRKNSKSFKIHQWQREFLNAGSPLEHATDQALTLQISLLGYCKNSSKKLRPFLKQ